MMPAYKGLAEQGTIREVLKDLHVGDVFWDEPLDRHTSMGVGGAADALVYPKDLDSLRRIVSVLSDRGIPYFPVGNWTNLIVGDGGFRGVIVALKALRVIRLTANPDADIRGIYAEAGLSLAEFVDYAAGSSLAGMEFCAGIPGSVGGAVRMNAGAFGREMKDIVSNVSVIHRDGSVVDTRRENLIFSYRDLELPEGSVLAAATFHLMKGSEKDVRYKIREIMDQRKARHPLADRSAGSVFKNPREIPAGRIIEELGLKGTAVGGAQISEKHGNFIVNKGNAKTRDILALIDLVQERVFRERGIKLELEVKIIGEMS